MGRDVSGNTNPIVVNPTSDEADSHDETATDTSHVSPKLSEEVKATDEEDRATQDYTAKSSATVESPDQNQGTTTKGTNSDNAGSPDEKTSVAAKRPIKKLSSSFLATFQPEDVSSGTKQNSSAVVNVQVKESIFGARKVFNRKPSSIAARPSDQAKDTVPEARDSSDVKVSSPAKSNDQTEDTVESSDKKKPNSADKVVNDKSSDDQNLNHLAAEGGGDQTKDVDSDTQKLNSDKKLNLEAEGSDDQMKDIVPNAHKSSDEKLSSPSKGNDQTEETGLTGLDTLESCDKKLSSPSKETGLTGLDTLKSIDKKLNSPSKGNDQMKETGPTGLDTPKSSDKKLSSPIKGNDLKETGLDTLKSSDKKLSSPIKRNDQMKETGPTGVDTVKSSDKKLSSPSNGNDQMRETGLTGVDTVKSSDKKLSSPSKGNGQMKETGLTGLDTLKSSDKKLGSPSKGNDQMKETGLMGLQTLKSSDKKLSSPRKGNDQMREMGLDTLKSRDKMLSSPRKGNDQMNLTGLDILKSSDKKLNLAAKGHDQMKDSAPDTDKSSNDKKLNSAAAKGHDQMKDSVPDTHKSSDKKLKGNDHMKDTVSDINYKPSYKKLGLSAMGHDTVKENLTTDHQKHVSTDFHLDGNESVESGGSSLNDTNMFSYPCRSKKSQQETHQASRKFQPEFRRHDEDNCSVASSTGSSARTNKFKITVPVAPTFKCVKRLEKRKEYYSKLEDKHHALEAEKMEYEARVKEEEKAIIKQLRKSMVFKANPVPSFYREGPPPKTELKKLPVTRPKSPKLTRRKSCGDVAVPEDKGVSPRKGSHSAKSPKIVKQNAKSTTTHHKVAEQQSADISVNG